MSAALHNRLLQIARHQAHQQQHPRPKFRVGRMKNTLYIGAAMKKRRRTPKRRTTSRLYIGAGVKKRPQNPYNRFVAKRSKELHREGYSPQEAMSMCGQEWSGRGGAFVGGAYVGGATFRSPKTHRRPRRKRYSY